MKIKFFTTGGTIDKIYFDSKSTYEVGESPLHEILHEANITFDYECEALLYKDSLEITPTDRTHMIEKIASDPHDRVVITHGTDTMVQTARELGRIESKTIVLTGSMAPARFRSSDAVFNIGFAAAAAQCLPFGIYIAMNGQIFDPDKVRKNIELNRFESIED